MLSPDPVYTSTFRSWSETFLCQAKLQLLSSLRWESGCGTATRAESGFPQLWVDDRARKNSSRWLLGRGKSRLGHICSAIFWSGFSHHQENLSRLSQQLFQ
jgi:hypothetical protein